MSRIRGRDTAPEKSVRHQLHRLGYRYRLYVKDLPGRPDLVFVSRRKVIFVHGCFWHGHDCTHGRRRPSTRPEYWEQKVITNRARDARKIRELREAGWRSLEIWDCEIRSGSWLRKVKRFLGLPGKGTAKQPH